MLWGLSGGGTSSGSLSRALCYILGRARVTALDLFLVGHDDQGAQPIHVGGGVEEDAALAHALGGRLDLEARGKEHRLLMREPGHDELARSIGEDAEEPTGHYADVDAEVGDGVSVLDGNFDRGLVAETADDAEDLELFLGGHDCRRLARRGRFRRHRTKLTLGWGVLHERRRRWGDLLLN